MKLEPGIKKAKKGKSRVYGFIKIHKGKYKNDCKRKNYNPWKSILICWKVPLQMSNKTRQISCILYCWYFWNRNGNSFLISFGIKVRDNAPARSQGIMEELELILSFHLSVINVQDLSKACICYARSVKLLWKRLVL